MSGKSFVSQAGVTVPPQEMNAKVTPIDENTQTFATDSTEESKAPWCPSGPESYFLTFGNITDPLKGRNR